MKRLIIGVVLLALLGVSIYGIYTARIPTSPRPYQEVADALAEYGWEIVDIEVDTIGRTIKIAVIPPEDDGGYVNGFFYILEWADEIIKPPVSGGKPIQGMYPGVLIIGEVTPDGPRVLLANGKVAQAYGMKRIMVLTWEGLRMFLDDDAEGTPWREYFETSDKVHYGVYQLSWFGLGQYGDYSSPGAFEVLEDGWFKAPEKPKIEPLKEKS